MKLYEIDREIESLVDPETGEILDCEAFEALQMEWERKLEGMVLWYKNLSAEAAAVKEEAENLTKRFQTQEKRAQRLKDYISAILDGRRFSTPRCSVTFRDSTSVDISDPVQVIAWAEKSGNHSCIRRKPPELDKRMVRRMLEDGLDVPCAQMVTKKNVRIR